MRVVGSNPIWGSDFSEFPVGSIVTPYLICVKTFSHIHNDINLKKVDRGSTTVVMNKTDKIKEGENLLNDEQSYRRLTEPIVEGNHNKVLHL